MAFFIGTVRNNQCLALLFSGADSCESAKPANSYSNSKRLEGPVPAGGGTVTNLEVTSSIAPGSGKAYTVTVMSNTSGADLLSCTISGSSTFCQNTGTASIPAGHYLQVKMTKTGNPSDPSMRVSFRY